MIPILEAIFGNRMAANTLLFIENYGSGYARRIAGTYDPPVSVVQDQLRKLESAGVLINSTVGPYAGLRIQPPESYCQQPASIPRRRTQNDTRFVSKAVLPRATASSPVW